MLSTAPKEPNRFHRLSRLVHRPAVASSVGIVGRIPSSAQLRYLPSTLTARESWIVRIATLLAVSSVVVLAVRFYQRHIVYLPTAGGEYVEALVGTPKFVNPLLAQTNDVDRDLTRLLFRSLYTVDAHGAVSGELAAHEEVSEDGKTYVITLRQGVLWHDGVALTAQDVAFTFERIQDPEAQSPLAAQFRNVLVEAVDDYTVRITLPEPYAPFLSTLSVGILPLHIWADIPVATAHLAEYNLKPIGAGPFAFESLTKDRLGNILAYRLVRFDDYYGDAPYLDALVLRFYPTTEEAIDALTRKKVDGLSFVSNEQRATIEQEHIGFHELRLPQYTAVFFNQRNALLKEKVIRQSLERALSKDEIVRVALGGAGEPIHTPILPGFLGHNPAVQGLAFDPDAARKALDEAGWVLLEGDTIRHKDGKELRFTLTTVDRPEYMATTELIRNYWRAIGVELDINLFSSNDILKKVIKPRDYEALLFGEIIGTDPDPYPFWHSSQSNDPGLNLAIFFNKQVDQLLEEARQTNDLEQRRLRYLHFQNILADELPAVFLYNPFYTYVLPTRVQGFTLETITVPADRFNGVEGWYVKTRKSWQ